jgi:dipeptidyl aminopeptidase/acylaminoacyl peptidase
VEDRVPLPRFIDVEAFFADPVFSGASISPDGTKLAYLAPLQGRTQVWVRGLNDTHEQATCVTHDARRGVKSYHWTQDPRWLTYLQDTDGNEDWHLFRVDLDDPAAPAVDLTPMDPGARVVSAEPIKDDPTGLLVVMNPRLLWIDTFRVDLVTGEQTVLFENDSMLATTAFAPNLDPYWAGLTDDGTFEIRRIDRETGAQRTILSIDGPEHPLGVAPVHFTPDGTGLVLGLYHDGDDLQLVRIDVETGDRTVVAGIPGHSLCTMSAILPSMPPTLYTSQKTGEITAARFVGDKPIIKVIDPAYEQLFADLAALSDGVLAGLSSNDEETLFVASFTGDLTPDETYLFERSTGKGHLLFRGYPDLDPSDLAPMLPISITARDGLPMHGFLTLPRGVDPQGLPLVLHVHGGPWAHDTWGYDRDTQMLANRGYAVLQPNFRGSSGYGKRHITAAVGELAGAMHDDLIDFADWAVKQGYADPSRIGIYGCSYGGYAALVGVTFTPDYFAASVAYCGISSLPNFMRALPDFVKPTMIANWLLYAGDPEVPAQLDDLLERSPITRVEQITTPLLVVQGANDPRVVQEEADNIVAALRERGVPVEYVLADDEGHGFQNPENLVTMWHAIEKHFAVHLGGRVS